MGICGRKRGTYEITDRELALVEIGVGTAVKGAE